MMRPVLFLAAFTVAAPALADTVRCKAVEDKPTVMLDVAFAENRDALTVTRLDADLGDFTISTAGNPPERIAGQESGDGHLDIDLTDPEDIWIVLRLRLVRASSTIGSRTTRATRIRALSSPARSASWAPACGG